MSKNREARFQSAREFRLAIEKHLGLDALKEATEGLKSLLATDGTTMVLPRTELTRRNTRRLRRIFAVASIAAAVSGIAIAGYFLAPNTLRGRIASVAARTAKTQPTSVTASPEGLFSAGISTGFDAEVPSDSAVPYPTPAATDALPGDSAGAAAAAPPLSHYSIAPGATGEDSGGVSSTPVAEEARDEASGTYSTATPDESGMRGRDSSGVQIQPETPEAPRTTPRDDIRTSGVTETTSEAAKVGWLSVTSDPPAEIYIDDRYIGEAPRTRIELASGTHTLECRSPKHEPYRETLYITAGELSPRTIVLVKPVGRISLSTIAGAEVQVDGVPIGVTPLEGPIELDAGRHQLTIKKPGFHTWNTSISIEAQQLLPLRITLSPIY